MYAFDFDKQKQKKSNTGCHCHASIDYNLAVNCLFWMLTMIMIMMMMMRIISTVHTVQKTAVWECMTARRHRRPKNLIYSQTSFFRRCFFLLSLLSNMLCEVCIRCACFFSCHFWICWAFFKTNKETSKIYGHYGCFFSFFLGICFIWCEHEDSTHVQKTCDLLFMFWLLD